MASSISHPLLYSQSFRDPVSDPPAEGSVEDRMGGHGVGGAARSWSKPRGTSCERFSGKNRVAIQSQIEEGAKLEL